MKRLNHIELFENFPYHYYPAGDPHHSSPVLIGYYAESGMGSHPTVVTEEELLRLGFEKSPGGVAEFWSYGPDPDLYFIVTSKSESLPDALACLYNSNYEWDIRGISSSVAEKAMKMMDGDYISYSPYGFGNNFDMGLINSLESMIGVTNLTTKRDDTQLTIISGPKINTVYWSDEPEMKHTYWMPPYRAMKLQDLVERTS
jgi:hypothetical protein